MTSPNKTISILAVLDEHYPDAHCTLDYGNPLELLVATILSAQCTDERVNQVTPQLFETYRTTADYAQAPLAELETAIRSTGFYRNKAKNIQSCCRELQERFAGKIPVDLSMLVQLPGIGRKTANVILGNAFHIPGIVVDTHVGRVSQRLRLTTNEDPVKIEFDLMELIPRERWVTFSHQLILHGRKVCSARKPMCSQCPLIALCNYAAESLALNSGGDAASPRRVKSKNPY